MTRTVIRVAGRVAGRVHRCIVAAQLIAERGYHAVRYYFPGKSEVLTEALHHAVDRAFDRQSVELKTIDNAHQAGW